MPDRRRPLARRIDAMLDGLARTVGELIVAAQKIDRGDEPQRQRAKQGFRDKVAEFEAVLSLLEGQIDQLLPEKRERVRRDIDRMGGLVLTQSIRCNIAFCEMILRHDFLPLWGRQQLAVDLETLRESRRRLGSPRAGASADPAELDRIDRLQDMLDDLIRRCPNLPDVSTPPVRARSAASAAA